jgi:hypothetical protein
MWWHPPTLKLRKTMALSNQIPASKDPQKADCPSASCSRILVSITRVELLALIQITLKARDGNRTIGNDAEALRLERRAKELLELSESDSENAKRIDR